MHLFSISINYVSQPGVQLLDWFRNKPPTLVLHLVNRHPTTPRPLSPPSPVQMKFVVEHETDNEWLCACGTFCSNVIKPLA